MIYIYFSRIKESNHTTILDNYLSFFSEEFQNRIARYVNWQDAQLSLLGRVLLVKGMEKMNYKFDKSSINYTIFNKPYTNNDNLNFNISHSGEIVLCALTNIGDIGIDVEKINPVIISKFKSQMTDNEWDLVSGSEDVECSFFNYWTRKEAVMKAHGNGLSIPIKSFEVLENRSFIGSDSYFLKEIKIQDSYSCHLAMKQSIDNFQIKISRLDF